MLDDTQLFEALPQDNPEFLHGFEVGRLCQQMTEGRWSVTGNVHNESVPAIMAISSACGKVATVTQSDEIWSWVEIVDEAVE